MKIVHIGCGDTIIPNAINIDYIRAFKYIRHPQIANVACHVGLLSKQSYQLVKDVQPLREYVKWGRATDLPIKDDYADAVYSCHMMEHLSRSDAERFLSEARRVLRVGGVFRLVLPNLQYYVQCYCKNRDADDFLQKTYLIFDGPENMRDKIKYLIYGRGIERHAYMYDTDSAVKLLEKNGFRDIRILKPGESILGEVAGLDLCARQTDSFYIECSK